LPKREKSFASSLIELVMIVAVALGLAFAIQAWVVKPYKIPSGSMEPTLQIGQRILVDRIGMHFSSPQIGDIMVFHPPADYNDPCANPDQGENAAGQLEPEACDVTGKTPAPVTFVKRVVGLPGDHLKIINGHVIRNGIREHDSYIILCNGDAACNFPQTIVIPKGEYYMMGDNRGDSEDSRFWGPVPKSWLIGYAFFTYWPLSHIGFL
jgi:signal peptidase I